MCLRLYRDGVLCLQPLFDGVYGGLDGLKWPMSKKGIGFRDFAVGTNS